MRRGLIVAQVALSLVLLSSGALVARSVDRLLRVDPGFNPEGLLTFRVRTPPEFFPKPADVVGFQDRVERALAASAGTAVISFPGAPGNTGSREHDAPLVDLIGTRASYVQVMGMHVVDGRGFEPVRQDGRQEVLVDRHLAERFFPNTSPIGTKIPWLGRRVTPEFDLKPSDALTIVGVVEQARQHDVHQDGRPQIYIRTEDWGFRPLSFVVRSAVDPEAIIPEARAALRQVEPRVAMGDLKTMNEIVADLLRPQRASAVAIGAFAVGSLLLAAMGLFGVVSSSVTRRRHEIAVRLAIGADHHRVLRLILSEGAVLVGLGVLIGIPGIYAAGRAMRGVLVGITPNDPLTLAAIAVALGLVTMAACYVPARRVLGIDPAQALRGE